MLILELLPDSLHRQARGELFPFLQAELRARKVPVDWVAVPVRFSPNLRYLLNPRTLARIGELLVAEKHEVVIYNEYLEPAALDQLRARAPGVRFLLNQEQNLGYLPRLLEQVLQQAPGELDFDGLLPDYSRTFLPGEAPLSGPLIKVFCGPLCSYHSPIKDNPAFHGVSGLGSWEVCSFCGSTTDAYGYKVASLLDFAAAQVEAAHQTLPPQLESIDFELTGIKAWRDLEGFFARILKLGIRPSRFFFSPRLDDLVRAGDQLLRVLPRLRDTGHRIQPVTIGIENFSPEENLRYHKGLTGETIAQGTRLLLELTRDFPETFIFPRDTGFSVIMFSPWTSLKDLKLNIEAMDHNPFVKGEYAMGTRVQLYPGRALTALAARDGLLTEALEDWFYNAGCLTDHNMEELPYRFLHPEVGLLFRFSRRLGSHHSVPEQDPDLAVVRTWRAGVPQEMRDDFRLFSLARDVLEQQPGITSVQALVQAVGNLIPGYVAQDPMLAAEVARMGEPDFGERLRSRLATGILAGRPIQAKVGLEKTGGAAVVVLRLVWTSGREVVVYLQHNSLAPVRVFHRGSRISCWHGSDGGLGPADMRTLLVNIAELAESCLLPD